MITESNVDINSTAFSYNTAQKESGGALYIGGYDGVTTIHGDTTFTNNVASAGGEGYQGGNDVSCTEFNTHGITSSGITVNINSPTHIPTSRIYNDNNQCNIIQ